MGTCVITSRTMQNQLMSLMLCFFLFLFVPGLWTFNFILVDCMTNPAFLGVHSRKMFMLSCLSYCWRCKCLMLDLYFWCIKIIRCCNHSLAIIPKSFALFSSLANSTMVSCLWMCHSPFSELLLFLPLHIHSPILC